VRCRRQSLEKFQFITLPEVFPRDPAVSSVVAFAEFLLPDTGGGRLFLARELLRSLLRYGFFHTRFHLQQRLGLAARHA
jgi:hypothetical protein